MELNLPGAQSLPVTPEPELFISDLDEETECALSKSAAMPSWVPVPIC